MDQDGYRVTENYVLFWGSEFSNFYPCKIVFDHKEFTSSEQLFMWCKAHCFQDYESEELILKAKTPKEAKKLGRLVKGYDDDRWSHVRFGYMRWCVYEKFRQNPKLKELLLKYGKAHKFVEGSPYDKIWGIGIHYQDINAEFPENWKGQNLLGKCLDMVYDELSTVPENNNIKMV